MEIIECYATDPTWGMSLGLRELRVHAKSDCVGEFCVIHNPSDHSLRDAPLNWRADRRPPFFERFCEHNVGHPDPDSVAYLGGKPNGAAVHGCCEAGCCA